jgi:hypothetical protein
MGIHDPHRSIRALNDLDFVAPDFDSIPQSLYRDFLFHHVHPLDPPGKIVLQCIDPETALRIDVFRACGDTSSRAVAMELESGPVQLTSLADLFARAARLLLDLADGVPVPAKHARDYLHLVELANPGELEAAWRDHRKPAHPENFREARGVLGNLIASRSGLLFTPQYSQDTGEICPRCAPTAAFPLADPKVVRSILGYC